ncbi:MAG: hypothetical protein ACXVFV_13075 [Mycobacteriales bacterium]
MPEPEEVPQEAAERARAALGARRHSATTLDIAHDTLVDGPLPAAPDEEPADRTVLFGPPQAQVRVDVRYDGSEPARLLVRTSYPAAELTLEALTPQPGVRLVLTGPPPLRLQVPAPGPVSLLLRRPGSPDAQTAWLVF